jgi:serine/threonine protein phosphatase PrpC
MNCPGCGADNRQGARFCRGCGQALAELPGSLVSEALDAEEIAAEEPLPSVDTEKAPGAAETVEPPSEEAPPGEPSMEAEAGQEPGAGPLPAPQAAEEPKTPPAMAEAPAAVEAPAGAVEDEGPEETALPAQGPQEAEEAEPLPEGEGEVLAFWREEGEPLAPAEPGTMIADRYRIAEILDAQDDEVLYLAHDVQGCWQCGFEDNASDDAFCAQCGASLDRKAQVRLVEVREAAAEPCSGEKVTARLAHEGRTFVLLAQPEPQVEAPAPPVTLRLLLGQRSDPGQVRELNEDSLLALTLAPTCESQTGPMLGLFAVADGMGGHEGGEVASKIALQVLAGQVLQAIVLPELAGEAALEEGVVVRLRQATSAANDAVYLARQKAGNDMGTTLTAAFVRDDRLFLAHVGDSRAYRWNAEGLEQLTADHSVIASMIASGQAAPEEVYTHPHRSIIYRCVGDKPVVEVDTEVLPLAAGDRLILCSDGLWEMVRSEGIADVMMQEAEPQAASDLLVSYANAAGGDDNISVIVVRVEAA